MTTDKWYPRNKLEELMTGIKSPILEERVERYKEFKEFDIVKIKNHSSVCSLKKGVYQGVVVRLAQEPDELSIVLTSVEQSKYAGNVSQISDPSLSNQGWQNYEITLVHRFDS